MPRKKKHKFLSYDEAASFCPHPPGSTEKIIVLEARLFYEIDLYHSGDNTIPIIPKDKRNAAKAEAESCPDAEIHLDDDDY
jgi:hypothetical protein